jgi:hypothetical protein
MHGIDEAETFLHGAFTDKLRDGVGNVEVIAPVRRFEPEMFSQRFHEISMSGKTGIATIILNEVKRQALRESIPGTGNLCGSGLGGQQVGRASRQFGFGALLDWAFRELIGPGAGGGEILEHPLMQNRYRRFLLSRARRNFFNDQIGGLNRRSLGFYHRQVSENLVALRARRLCDSPIHGGIKVALRPLLRKVWQHVTIAVVQLIFRCQFNCSRWIGLSNCQGGCHERDSSVCGQWHRIMLQRDV